MAVSKVTTPGPARAARAAGRLASSPTREVEEETGLRLKTPGRLAFVVNTTTAQFPSALVLFFECTDWDGTIAPADPDADVTEAILASPGEAARLLPCCVGRLAP